MESAGSQSLRKSYIVERFDASCWIYDFSHIFFPFISCRFFFGFFFIFSPKVAVTLKVNNFWYFGQIPIKLYIFGILRAFWVELYQKTIKNVWCVTSPAQKSGLGANASKIVKNTPLFWHICDKLSMFSYRYQLVLANLVRWR